MPKTLLTVVIAAIVLVSLACVQRQVTATPGALDASAAVKIIGSADFDSEVLNSDIPVLVDFFATWCGPCKRLAPIIDQIAAERAGKVKFVRVDVDESKDLAHKYNIDAMPTLVLFDKGAEKTRWVGYMSKADLDAKLDGALNP